MRTAPATSRQRLGVTLRGLWSLALLSALALGLERLGPSLHHDLADALVLVGLTGVAALLGRWHRAAPHFWLKALYRGLGRIGAWLVRFEVEAGLDFRLHPKVARGVPGMAFKPTLALGVLCALLVPVAPALPEGLRGAVAPLSYNLYLLLLVALWSGLIGGSLFLLFFVHGQIHDLLLARFVGQGQRPLRLEMALHAGALAAFSVVLAATPPWVSLLLLAGASLVVWAALLSPGGPRLTLLWRSRQGSGEPRSISLLPFWSLHFLAFLTVVTLLLLLALGDPRPGRPAERTMFVTPFLGELFTWAAAAGVSAMAARLIRFLALRRHLDPARAGPPVVHVSAPLRPEHLDALAREARQHGFAVRAEPASRRPTDVAIRVDSSGTDPFAWPVPGPLKVAPSELGSPETWRRIARRERLQCRRLLYRGLSRLLKWAARLDRKQGEGYWIGLQHWFVLGLGRDQEEAEPHLREDAVVDQIIGPPYHVVFPPRVRLHFLDVTRALEVDLLFVEDGLGFRKLRRVLEVLFEVHDSREGRARVEEHHFAGLPGVRVVIQELSPGQRFLSDVYPEPDTEQIGRARLLLVFRDRGGEMADLPDPADFAGIPLGA